MYNKFFKLFFYLCFSIVLFTIVMKNTESFTLEEKYMTLEESSKAAYYALSGDDADDGLYDDNDDVVPLHSNMMGIIGTSSTAWLVQFYMSWCGHCQRFAPTWKSLASSLVGWNDSVIIAAIDCANWDYRIPCINITQAPIIKYYSPGAETLEGHYIKSRTEEQLRHDLIEKLRKEKQDGNLDTLPNIFPFSGNNSTDVWKEIPDTVKYLFFVFEDTTSFLGSEVILDLHKMEYLQLQRVTEDNRLFCSKYNITSFPALIVLHREEEQVRLSLPEPTKESVVQTIKDFMKSKGLFTEPEKPVKVENNVEESQNNIKNDEHSNLIERLRKDLLYQVDLEKTLRYSLGQEIPLWVIIEGRHLQALKNFLRVLSEYIPLQEGKSEFLIELYNNVSSRTNIKGSDFKDLLVLTEERMYPVFYEDYGWIGCAGSEPRFRKFPCGLWTLFHTLTVRHAEAFENEESETRNVGTILNVMHEYISNFFACYDCVGHFKKMAEEEKIFEVKSIDDTILWLWRAHNKVNSRLAGDITEDPKVPKIQYPSQENCGVCRNSDDTWNEPEVLNYLKKKYRSSQIIHDFDDYE